MRRDRDAEFRAEEIDQGVLVGKLRDAAGLVGEILGASTPEMLEQTRIYPEGQTVTVRSILMRRAVRVTVQIVESCGRRPATRHAQTVANGRLVLLDHTFPRRSVKGRPWMFDTALSARAVDPR